MSDTGKLKIIVSVDNAFRKNIHHNILSHTTREEYDVYSNEEGISIIELPLDTYSITSTYTSDNVVYDSQVNTIVIKSPMSSYINILEVNLSSCRENVLLDKTCKYFHHDPYMTPNNFDLYFDYNNIPSNIITETPSELHQRLQSCLPVDKILHLNLDTENEKKDNLIHVHGNVVVNYKKSIINSDNDNLFNPKLFCEWNDALLLDYLFEMQSHDLLNALGSNGSVLDLEYVVSEEDLLDDLNNLINDNYYSIGGDVLRDRLTDFFNDCYGILNLSSTSLITIGRNNTTQENLSDVELSIAGKEFIDSCADAFVDDGVVILTVGLDSFYKTINVDLYEDNVLIYTELPLDDSNNYTNTLDESFGIGYVRGIFNVADTELFMVDESNGVKYENTDLIIHDSLNFTYTQGVLTTPSEYDKIKLHVFKTREDESILKFELKDYSIEFTEYHFYTCQNCGKVIYSDEMIVECEECNHTDMIISDVPYKVVMEDYSKNYYSNEQVKLL